MNIFRAGDYTFELGKKTYIMGIVNVTPDSFSDGGKYNTAPAALEHARQSIADGADIIDLGAVSTRPGCSFVSVEEELSRLTPVFEGGITKLGVAVSVDTFNAKTAEYCLENGAAVINDVSGTFNGEIASMCKKYGAGYVVMHNPAFSSDKEAVYPDGVVADVRKFFIECIEKAASAGMPAETLCLDPGIGFSKSREEDAELIRNMQWLVMKPYALLFGVSRKRITAYDGNKPSERDYSTSAANTCAAAGGADIIRVHNVQAAKGVCAFADLIYRSK